MNDMKQLTSWVSGVLGVVTALVSIVALFRISPLAATIIITGFPVTMLLIFLYMAFARTPPLIVGGKGVYRFGQYRHLALIGAGVIVVLVVAALVFKPSRSFITTSFAGTGTATPSPTPTVMTTPTTTLTPASVADASMILDELEGLRNEVLALQQRIDNLEQSVPVTTTIGGQEPILEEIDSLNTRLEVIELVILDNPAKALELTLLTRDMENLQENYKAELQSARDDIDRVYDQNKWFLGLMFTIALGVTGLAVSNFLPKPKKENSKKE